MHLTAHLWSNIYEENELLVVEGKFVEYFPTRKEMSLERTGGSIILDSRPNGLRII